jgi:D-alanyl-D-alanine carboxypeptidase
LPQGLFQKLDSVLSSFSRKPGVSELKLQVSGDGSDLDYSWRTPGAKDTHLIASSTKLFAAALVQQLADEGKLQLTDSIGKHLPKSDYENLNVQSKVDLSDQITVRDLLSHTSGIGDYYQLKRLPKKGDLARISEQDPGWSFEEAISLARTLRAQFPPNSGKANYSFTNYQLVGRLIESVTREPLGAALRTRIFEPLELRQTTLLTPGDLESFHSASQVLIGNQPYLGARRIASLGAEGAIVSSTEDTTKFMKQFFSGTLVSGPGRDTLMRHWLPIFPGVKYSSGVMSLGLPRFATRASHRSRYLGHSGATGHFMFFDPINKITVVGTTNQLQPSIMPYRLMASVLRIINSA